MAGARRQVLVVHGPAPPLCGALDPPGDKSITHRALILGALARGTTIVENALDSDDTRATAQALVALGASLRRTDGRVEVTGPLSRDGPPVTIDCRESGTTARLLAGVAAGLARRVTLDGAPPLRRRPMARVTVPLGAMGARIEPAGAARLPFTIDGGDLVAATHRPEVPSAQVKGALLLAGLRAVGRTVVVLPSSSRDHTERLLPVFGVPVEAVPNGAAVLGPAEPRPCRVHVPGDVSSALYLGVAAALIPGSDLVLHGVLANPTRSEPALAALEALGVQVVRGARAERDGEARADLRFTSPAGPRARLDLASRGRVDGPAMLDEVPLLAALAGRTARDFTIEAVGELRHKESDRVAASVELVRVFGGQARVVEDPLTGGETLLVAGGPPTSAPRTIDSHGDHRVALTAAVLALACEGRTTITGFECVAKSWPTFLDQLRGLLGADAARVLATR